MKTKEEMRKEGRGSSVPKLSEDGSVVLVRWQDNGIANMASTHVGHGNVGSVKRWSEATKKHIDIECPEVTSEYNIYMGESASSAFYYLFNLCAQEQENRLYRSCPTSRHLPSATAGWNI